MPLATCRPPVSQALAHLPHSLYCLPLCGQGRGYLADLEQSLPQRPVSLHEGHRVLGTMGQAEELRSELMRCS